MRMALLLALFSAISRIVGAAAVLWASAAKGGDAAALSRFFASHLTAAYLASQPSTVYSTVMPDLAMIFSMP